MVFEMQKAVLLAENINGFIKFVLAQKNNNHFRSDSNKLLQIKLWVEDFRFQVVADELQRINQFDWNEKYSYYLVDQFRQGITVIDEYVKYHYNDLFIFTARLHTLKSLISSFGEYDMRTNPYASSSQ